MSTTKLHSTKLSELTGGHLSHDEVAGKVRMLMRTDFDHEAVCMMARDRIKWMEWEINRLENLVNGRDENGKLIPSEPFVQSN
jgi:hypothetical protein